MSSHVGMTMTAITGSHGTSATSASNSPLPTCVSASSEPEKVPPT
jgi:hypothetical protein